MCGTKQAVLLVDDTALAAVNMRSHGIVNIYAGLAVGLLEQVDNGKDYPTQWARSCPDVISAKVVLFASVSVWCAVRGAVWLVAVLTAEWQQVGDIAVRVCTVLAEGFQVRWMRVIRVVIILQRQLCQTWCQNRCRHSSMLGTKGTAQRRRDRWTVRAGSRDPE